MGNQQKDFSDFIGLNNEASVRIRLTASEDGREATHNLYTDTLLVDDAEYGAVGISGSSVFELGVSDTYHYVLLVSDGQLKVGSAADDDAYGQMTSVYFREFLEGTPTLIRLTNPSSDPVVVKFALFKRANTEEPF